MYNRKDAAYRFFIMFEKLRKVNEHILYLQETRSGIFLDGSPKQIYIFMLPFSSSFLELEIRRREDEYRFTSK